MSSSVRFVYVISSPFGYQKIGWSIDPEGRCVTLSTAHPLPLKLHTQWQHVRASEVEQRVHRILEPFRANGEWFHVTAEQAVETVEAVMATTEMALGIKKKPRRHKPRKHRESVPRWTQKWSQARADLLMTRWSEGVSTRFIRDELNALEGPSLSMTYVCTKIRLMGLKRPEGFEATHDSSKWTWERDTFLKAHYPAGMLPETMLIELNRMQGRPLDVRKIRSRAHKLGLRRPPDFSVVLGESFRSRRWTKERDDYLREAYTGGELPQVILATVLSMKGQRDITWDVVRERAKNKGWRRPENFMHDLGVWIKRRAA